MSVEALAADVARLTRAVENLKRELADVVATATRVDQMIATDVDGLSARVAALEEKP